jgi:hypothetical protein
MTKVEFTQLQEVVLEPVKEKSWLQAQVEAVMPAMFVALLKPM